ncbi:MAG: hypothetical protein RIC36_04155 [Rhodospirillales bacterium]
MSFGKLIEKLLGLKETEETGQPSAGAVAAKPPAPPDVEVEVFRMPSQDDLDRRAVIRNAMSVHRAKQANLDNLTEEERQKLRAIAEQAFLAPDDGQTRH